MTVSDQSKDSPLLHKLIILFHAGTFISVSNCQINVYCVCSGCGVCHVVMNMYILYKNNYNINVYMSGWKSGYCLQNHYASFVRYYFHIKQWYLYFFRYEYEIFSQLASEKKLCFISKYTEEYSLFKCLQFWKDCMKKTYIHCV